MKKAINLRFQLLSVFLICASFLFWGTGCLGGSTNDDPEISATTSVIETIASSHFVTEPSTATSAEISTSETEISTETTEDVTEPQSTQLTDIHSIGIYSSYAYMVSFDPGTGYAEFDYFDKLIGQEAIDWLVEHEGYTLEDAEDLVNNFADTEYVEKNINPRLRTIDMRTVFITTNLDENEYLELPQVPLDYSDFVSRADSLIIRNPYTRIIVEDNEIIEVIVGVFMG